MPTQPVAPDAEEKLKRSQIVLLAIAGIYLLNQIMSYFLSPKTVEVMGETVPVEANPVSAIVGSVIGLALFSLVYFLMQNRKKAGRITGYVFATLGCIVSIFSLIGGLLISPVVVVLSLLWLVGSIVWIVFVSNKSVSSILR